MLVQNDAFMEQVLESFSGYYDIEKMEESDQNLYATGAFHQIIDKYVLFKNAKLWEVQAHDYVYFFNLPSFNAAIYENCLTYAHEEGMKLISPNKNHMYSYITLVIVCDDVDNKDAIKKLKRCRIHKDFKLSFHGWMDVRTVIVNKGNKTVQTNHMGKDLVKLFQKLLQSI